jgi:predicted Zn-dependent protease with MMP-like domain
VIDVTPERFDELVDEALEAIPPSLLRLVENVAVVVEEEPTAAQREAHGGLLLGLYEGVRLTDRSPMSYSGVMPDRITIFRANHRRVCANEEDLRSRITKTVVHEIGHHFGIGDDRLTELGW